MTKNKKLLLAATLVTVAGLVIANLHIFKKYKHKKRLAVVSDAGYETAWDVHFPLKNKKSRRVS